MTVLRQCAFAVAMVLLLLSPGASVAFPTVFLASLVALLAGLPGLPALWADARQRPALVGVGIVALWLLAVQFQSLDPEQSLGPTLLVFSALALALAARDLAARGAVRSTLLLVMAPAAAWSLVCAWRIGFTDVFVRGLRDTSNLADALLLAMLAALGGLLVRRAGRERTTALDGLLGAGAALLTLGCIAHLLESRVAVAIALLALVLLLLAEFGRGHRDRWLLAWPLGGALGVALPSVVALFIGPPAAPVAPAVLPTGPLGAVDIRLGIYGAALDLLPQAGTFGVGLLNYQLLYAPVRQPDAVHGATMVHSDFIQLALELGWPAALALIGACAALAWRWLRFAAAPRRAPRDARGVLDSALGLGVLAVLGHALVNFPLYDGSVLAMLLVTVAIVTRPAGAPAVSVSTGSPAPPAAPARVALGAALAVPLLVGALILYWQGALVAWGSVMVKGLPIVHGLAPVRLTRDDVEAAASRLRRLHAPGGYWAFEHGRILAARWEAGERRDSELAAAALGALAEAVARDPLEPEFTIQYARLLRETGASLEPRRTLLERLAQRRPEDARVHLALVVHLLMDGEEAAARSHAREQWLPWCALSEGRPREAADLLALAATDAPAYAEALESCGRVLAGFGIVANRMDDLRARFPVRP